MPLELSTPQIFRPVQNSRRSELLLWALALLAFTGWLILRANTNSILILSPVLTVLLFFFAGAVSLGNWMDRNTELELSRAGIRFRNGLRRKSFSWDQIRQVWVVNAAMNAKRIYVITDSARFSFKTLSVARHRGSEVGRSGFVEAEAVLETILARTGLERMNESAGREVYYARE